MPAILRASDTMPRNERMALIVAKLIIADKYEAPPMPKRRKFPNFASEKEIDLKTIRS